MIKNQSHDNYTFKMEYQRIIEDLDKPIYRDIKFDVYFNGEYMPIYFWIDCNEKTIEITSGYYHDEPLPKNVVDIIIEKLDLNKYTLI